MGNLLLKSSKFKVQSSKIIILTVTLFFLPQAIFGSSKSLPLILQIVEKAPENLRDIEELIDYRWFNQAWEALKSYPEDEEVLFLKAKALMGLKRYEEALSLFQKFIQTSENPKVRRDSLLKKAMILTKLKRYREATGIYENFKLFSKGFKVALEARDYKKGLNLLRGVKGPETIWWRGWCLFRLGKLNEAIKTWEALLKGRKKEFHPQVIYWKAVALENLNLKKQANQALEELLQKYPTQFYGFLARFKLNLKTDGLNSEIPAEKYPEAFDGSIEREAKRRGLDPYLVFALIWQESRFREEIVSPTGAIGLMQLMPQTALTLAKASNTKHFQLPDILDPTVNIKLGCFYLKFLKKLFSDQVPLALAAYNAGEEAVSRWLSLREEEPIEIFIEEIPFDETQKYVKKVMTAYWIYHWLYEGKVPLLTLSN